MFLVNFHVYQEASRLKIRINLIQKVGGYHQLDIKFDDNKLNLVLNTFESRSLPTITFRASMVNAQGEKRRYHLKQSAAIFDLPNIPSIALLWLHCVNRFMDTIEIDDEAITGVFFRPSLINRPNKPGHAINMGKYLKLENYKYHPTLRLLEEILKFNTIAEYKPTLLAIKRCHEIYKGFVTQTPEREFSECFDNKEFSDYILCDDLEENLLNPEMDHAEKLNLFVRFVSDNIESASKLGFNDFSFLNEKLTRLNRLAKRRLFAGCVGILSHEGVKPYNPSGAYHWGFTEWPVIYHADIYIRIDGRMSFINLKDNPGYLPHYAEGKLNHFIFQDEMKFLGKIIGLEFDVDSDFGNELILTKECTEKLMSLGLHFNVNYAKNILQAYHSWKLYRQLGNNNSSPFNLFRQLPIELNAMIMSHAHPPISRVDEMTIASEVLSPRKMG